MNCGEARKAFGEDRARARGGMADETTYMKSESDPLSGAGAISEAAPVTAVNTGRAMTTHRTGSSAPRRADGEDDALIVGSDGVNMQTGKVGKQLRETHR